MVLILVIDNFIVFRNEQRNEQRNKQKRYYKYIILMSIMFEFSVCACLSCQTYIDIFYNFFLFSLAEEQREKTAVNSHIFLCTKSFPIHFLRGLHAQAHAFSQNIKSGVYMRGSGGSGCWICCGWSGGGSCRASSDSKPWPCGGGVPSALEGSVMSPP